MTEHQILAPGRGFRRPRAMGLNPRPTIWAQLVASTLGHGPHPAGVCENTKVKPGKPADTHLLAHLVLQLPGPADAELVGKATVRDRSAVKNDGEHVARRIFSGGNVLVEVVQTGAKGRGIVAGVARSSEQMNRDQPDIFFIVGKFALPGSVGTVPGKELDTSACLQLETFWMGKHSAGGSRPGCHCSIWAFVDLHQFTGREEGLTLGCS